MTAEVLVRARWPHPVRGPGQRAFLLACAISRTAAAGSSLSSLFARLILDPPKTTIGRTRADDRSTDWCCGPVDASGLRHPANPLACVWWWSVGPDPIAHHGTVRASPPIDVDDVRQLRWPREMDLSGRRATALAPRDRRTIKQVGSGLWGGTPYVNNELRAKRRGPATMVDVVDLEQPMELGQLALAVGNVSPERQPRNRDKYGCAQSHQDGDRDQRFSYCRASHVDRTWVQCGYAPMQRLPRRDAPMERPQTPRPENRRRPRVTFFRRWDLPHRGAIRGFRPLPILHRYFTAKTPFCGEA